MLRHRSPALVYGKLMPIMGRSALPIPFPAKRFHPLSRPCSQPLPSSPAFYQIVLPLAHGVHTHADSLSRKIG